MFVFFFFRQKTAYEMRISDWSSDVCSSDLGNLDIVLGDDLSDAQRRMLSNAARAAERGARLTRQLLAFARKTRLEPRRINMNEIGRASCRERVCQSV